MKKKDLKKRIITSIALIFFIFLMFNSQYLMTFGLLVFGILSLMEFFNLSKKIFDKKIYYFLSNLCFILFISIFSFFFFLFYNFEQSKFIVLVLLIGCIASDIGGYVFGNLFKGPKLTKISPNKTITGAIGSLFLACLILLFLFKILSFNLNFNILVIGIATSVGSQVGDLFFSYLKRKANLKDTGNLLPGHGGVLDRVDGILLGLPVGFTTLILIL